MAEIGWREAIEIVAGLLRPDAALRLGAPEEAPARGGAYVLVLHLDRPLSFGLARKTTASFEPGTYVYSGSAYGPGGIRARLARHFRRDKKLHWHVDRLTVAASGMEAIAVEAGSECEIIERLAGSNAFVPVVAGFGSSDCSRCTAHLLQWLGPDSQTGKTRKRDCAGPGVAAVSRREDGRTSS